jgi:hypothetical protein
MPVKIRDKRKEANSINPLWMKRIEVTRFEQIF